MSSRCPVGQVCLNFFHRILTPIASGRTSCLTYNLGHRGTEMLSDVAKVTQLKAATAGIPTHASLNSVPETARDLWSHFVEYSWSQLSNPFRGKHSAFFFFLKIKSPLDCSLLCLFQGTGSAWTGGGDGGEEERAGERVAEYLQNYPNSSLIV